MPIVKDRPVVLKKNPTPTRNGTPWPLARMHRFTVEQYHRMIKVGVLKEDDRVELLEGWVVEKMPQNPTHSGTISVLLRILLTLLPKGWIVRVQCPITLTGSEPEPDLAIVRGPEERYFSNHPTAADVALLIEIADTTLELDRTTKLRAYARAGIPSYWIVNLVESTVEVYRQPRAGKSPKYQSKAILSPDEFAHLLIDGRDRGRVPVRRLFP